MMVGRRVELLAAHVAALALVCVSVGLGHAVAGRAMAQAGAVVISQVYGGGGNSGATYVDDFIEIFNRGSTAVNLSGWSLQYAPATSPSPRFCTRAA